MYVYLCVCECVCVSMFVCMCVCVCVRVFADICVATSSMSRIIWRRMAARLLDEEFIFGWKRSCTV